MIKKTCSLSFAALFFVVAIVVSGCAVRHAPPSAAGPRRHTRADMHRPEAPRGRVVEKGRIDYVDHGGGAPEQREVPALVVAYGLPEPPAPTPRRVEPSPTPERSRVTMDDFDVAQDRVPVLAGSVYRLRVHDNIVVTLRGIPEEAQIAIAIDEDGYINLPYIERLLAVGMTRSELEQAIRRAYLDQRIYRDLSVNVKLPTQSYFVRGEVRSPNRYPLQPGMTMLQALAAAGGYTEFANIRRIRVVRGSEVLNIDARDLEQNPEDDIEVEPGDMIIVPRSII